MCHRSNQRKKGQHRSLRCAEAHGNVFVSHSYYLKVVDNLYNPGINTMDDLNFLFFFLCYF